MIRVFVKPIQRQAVIAVAEAEVVERERVVAEVEVGADVFAGVENADAVVAEKVVAEAAEDEMFRVGMNLDLMAAAQEADEKIVARVVRVVEVGELEAEAHAWGRAAGAKFFQAGPGPCRQRASV